MQVPAKIQAGIKKPHASACYLQNGMKPKQAEMQGALRR